MIEFNKARLDIQARKQFGYPPRAFQIAATRSICSERDTVVVAPTGSGKSFMFHAPSLLLDDQHSGMVVTVTPLKALQVEQAKKDPHSIYVNEDNKTKKIISDIREKKYRRIYLAPEQLQSDDIRALCKDAAWTTDLMAYIVDEAHVVIEWGGTFRPVYQTLSDLRHIGGRKVPILALSATLPLTIYKELEDKLELTDPTVINIGARGPNIHLKLVPFKESIAGFQDVLDNLPEMGGIQLGDPIEKLRKTVIYVNDKRQVRRLYEFLSIALSETGLGHAVMYHHASASKTHRRLVEEGFKNGTYRWIIATDSLGMGADIKDIDRVIQVRAGESAAACMQRVGRAGRDGVTQTHAIILVEEKLLQPASKRKGKPTEEDGVTEGSSSPVEVSLSKEIKKEKDGSPVIQPAWLAMIRNNTVCPRKLLEDHFKGPASTVVVDDDRQFSAEALGNYGCCNRSDLKKAVGEFESLVDDDGNELENSQSASQKRKRGPANTTPRKSDDLVSRAVSGLFEWLERTWEQGDSEISSVALGRDGILESYQIEKVARLVLRINRTIDFEEAVGELKTMAHVGYRRAVAEILAGEAHRWDREQELELIRERNERDQESRSKEARRAAFLSDITNFGRDLPDDLAIRHKRPVSHYEAFRSP